jgi:ABC-type transport system substrate-binding protein
MSLLDRARKDAQRFLTDTGGFAVQLDISDDEGNTASVTGLFSNHHVSVSTENVPVNSAKRSITVAEQAFERAGYPVRNSNGEVALEGHKVTYRDSTGQPGYYRVAETFADETIGNIVLILAKDAEAE